jgi:hypothetical protein
MVGLVDLRNGKKLWFLYSVDKSNSCIKCVFGLGFCSGNSWTIGTKNFMFEDRLKVGVQSLYENDV